MNLKFNPSVAILAQCSCTYYRLRHRLAAVAMAALLKKRTLDEDMLAETPTKKTKAGSMPEADLKEAMRKAIYDNLKDLSDAEMDGILNDRNMTCRASLKERKQQNFADPVNYPCGKVFYKELRQIFRSSEHPLAVLARAAEGEDHEVSPVLIKSMQEFQKTGKRAGMLGYLKLCSKLNPSEMFGVFNFAWHIRPESQAHGQLAAVPTVAGLIRQAWLEVQRGHIEVLALYLGVV